MEVNNQLYAYKYKWGKSKVKIPTEFVKSYPDAKFEIINQENYLNFISLNTFATIIERLQKVKFHHSAPLFL